MSYHYTVKLKLAERPAEVLAVGHGGREVTAAGRCAQNLFINRKHTAAPVVIEVTRDKQQGGWCAACRAGVRR